MGNHPLTTVDEKGETRHTCARRWNKAEPESVCHSRETVNARGDARTASLISPELTRADRCDRCGAAARVRAKLPSGGELLFCGHHARKHSDRLAELEAQLEHTAD